MDDSSDEYKYTLENRRLLKKMLPKKELSIQFFEACNSLAKDYKQSELTFMDYSSTPTYDRCVKGCFIFYREGAYISVGVYISVLVPCMVIIESPFNKGRPPYLIPFIINQQVSEPCQQLKEYLSVRLQEKLGKYSSVSDEVLNSPVPDIIIDAAGAFSNSNSINLPYLTGFNVLFTGFIF